MIGVFDSGSGGLTFLHEAQKLLPYEFLYFGDYTNCPYGAKSEKKVYELTKKGVETLRDNGATIVILACNTATSAAIKKLQKHEKHIGVKVLGVTIPGAEKVLELGLKKITVLATNASVKNKLYKTRVGILDREVEVQEIALPELAILIEQYLSGNSTESELKKYLNSKLQYAWDESEAVILGCTHYSHIKDIFQNYFPKKIIIDPSLEAAKKLKLYLKNHPEIEKTLKKAKKKDSLNLAILCYLQTIPEGKVTSYKDVAERFGVHPRKVAAVMKYNQFPALYPCYKVLAHNGKLSGYNTKRGVAEKIEKLKKDGVEVRDGEVERKYFV